MIDSFLHQLEMSFTMSSGMLHRTILYCTMLKIVMYLHNEMYLIMVVRIRLAFHQLLALKCLYYVGWTSERRLLIIIVGTFSLGIPLAYHG